MELIELAYSIFILSLCIYIEKRAKEKIDHRELEQAIGYSYPYIRKTFKNHMRIPLARYILLRKLSYAAFDLVHTEKRLLDIAVDCGFEQYDTFTRAFKRETGMLPSDFRQMRARAGRRLVASGVYAPAILDIPSPTPVTDETEVIKMESDKCILLGVPKVEYKWEECTPFPSCLKACLNYMGQDITYAYLMAASGAAFRLRWNKKYWDGGNVDICYIYEDWTEAFRRSFEAAGRSCRLLKRDVSRKQDFIDFIKAEISDGRPVIALGIIGPPEACIVTGYQNDGNALLGWNFFQHRPEYNNGTAFHENGYFISDKWWENKDTLLLMSIGEAQGANISDKHILQNALDIVEREPIVLENCNCEIACGQEAYRLWAEWTADDKRFGKNITLPLLYDRFMCQTDAQTMVGEGRWYASQFLNNVGERHPEVSQLCAEASGLLCKASNVASKQMYEVLGKGHHEEKVRRYAEPETRRLIVGLIREAAASEAKAMELVREIVEKLSSNEA